MFANLYNGCQLSYSRSLGLPNGTSILTAIGSQAVAKFNEATKSANAYNQIVVFMAVICIPQFATDVVITLNCPVSIGADSSSAALVDHVSENLGHVRHVFKAILGSFKVHDWSLFSA